MVVAATATLAPATTLQRLSLEDLARESTAVVRGTVAEIRTEQAGPLLYTVARVEIAQAWKGDGAKSIEVSSPGGVWRGAEQRFPGAPRLESGREYVLFLWTGPSGRTQITGLAQGVFEVRPGDAGPRAIRAQSVESLIVPGSSSPDAPAAEWHLPTLRARVVHAAQGGDGR